MAKKERQISAKLTEQAALLLADLHRREVVKYARERTVFEAETINKAIVGYCSCDCGKCGKQ